MTSFWENHRKGIFAGTVLLSFFMIFIYNFLTPYYTDDYGSVECYINEIKCTNGLQEDTIHENAYLLIPYYDNYKK